MFSTLTWRIGKPQTYGCDSHPRYHRFNVCNAAICTDSQSLLKAIQSRSTDTTDLRRMLNKRAGKTTLADPPPCHCRTKEVYTKTFSWPADCRAVSTRRDAVLLARLRAGHTPFLKAYANQLDTIVDPKCPSCG